MLKPLDDIDTYVELQNFFERLKQTFKKSLDIPLNLWQAVKHIFITLNRNKSFSVIDQYQTASCQIRD